MADIIIPGLTKPQKQDAETKPAYDLPLKTFQEFLQDFRYSDLTIEKYVYRQREYMRSYDWTVEDVLKYIRKHKYNVATMHFIKLLLEWRDKPELLKALPQKRGKADNAKKKDKGLQYLTPTQIKLLIEYCDTHHLQNVAVVILLMFKYGLRIREVVTLDKASFNFEQNELSILGKGNKHRYALITEEDSKYFKDITRKFGSDEKIFANRRLNDKISNLCIYYWRKINYVGKIVLPNIKSVHPHMLRHSCGTYLANQGRGLHEIKEYLGHVDISTTQVYVDIPNKKKFRDYSNELGEMVK